MKFIQCEMRLTTSGKTMDDLMLNARAIGKCRYDFDGRMKHGG